MPLYDDGFIRIEGPDIPDLLIPGGMIFPSLIAAIIRELDEQEFASDDPRIGATRDLAVQIEALLAGR